MSAAMEIAELDSALAEDGENIVLRRTVGTSTSSQQFIDVTVRAFVRGYEQPTELVGAITQQNYRVIFSPTQIDAAQWPGGHVPSTAQFQVDPRIPDKNRNPPDVVYLHGKRCTIEDAKPIYIGDTLIRINMDVRG